MKILSKYINKRMEYAEETINNEWETIKERIDIELSHKHFACYDDLHDLLQILGIDLENLKTFALETNIFDLIFMKYENMYPKRAIYKYVYDEETEEPLNYEIIGDRLYPRKVLISRYNLPPNYIVTTERRIIKR
jgi:hypothetical protein